MAQVHSQTFSAAQSGTLLVDAPARANVCLEGVIFTAHADNAVSPSMAVRVGGVAAVSHPGVPAGGGLVATNLGISGQDSDISFDCSDPQGGSVSVSVIYRISN